MAPACALSITNHNNTQIRNPKRRTTSDVMRSESGEMEIVNGGRFHGDGVSVVCMTYSV